jgi:carboxymethylenebutenolidase
LCDRNQPKRSVKAVPQALTRPTLDTDTPTTTRKAAGSHPGRLTARSGLGGRVGWRIAAAYPQRVAALAAFHAGGLVSDDENSPHLSAGAISSELYLGHADNDQSMTPEHIAALEQALEQAGVRYRSELYQGAAHGYTMSDTAAYDEAAAERHFTELFALLDRTIAG